MVCIGWLFSPGTPVSSTNKTDCHNITEILLKVVLNTIYQPTNQFLRQNGVGPWKFTIIFSTWTWSISASFIILQKLICLFSFIAWYHSPCFSGSLWMLAVLNLFVFNFQCCNFIFSKNVIFSKLLKIISISTFVLLLCDIFLKHFLSSTIWTWGLKYGNKATIDQFNNKI